MGVDDEFDIYEDLNLDAILVAAGAEDGIVTSLDPTGTFLISHSSYHIPHITYLSCYHRATLQGHFTHIDPSPLAAVAGTPLSPGDSAVRVGDAPVEVESTGELSGSKVLLRPS